jgi:hypothetical protein
VIAFALVLPWRIWYTSHDIPSVGDTGYDGPITDLDRLWPAFEITVRSFVHEDLWHIAPLLAVAAIVLALLAGAWRISLYASALLGGGVAAVTWILWVSHDIILAHGDWPIRRFVGTPALVLAVLTPLLLQRAWSAGPEGTSRLGVLSVLSRPTSASWAIVLVGLVSHPVSALVGYSGSGLPGGWVSFPGTGGCDAAPVDGAKARLVVGYADSYPEANALRDRARAAGLDDVEANQDGCGRLRVYVDDLPPVAARRMLAEAQATGLGLTLELDPDD